MVDSKADQLQRRKYTVNMNQETKNTGQHWYQLSPAWRLIYIVSMVMFSFGVLIIIRPDTTTNRFISDMSGIQIDFLAMFFLLMSVFVWALYYFIRNLFAVLVSLMPLVLAVFYLVIQIAQSPTAPLFHLGTSLWFLALLLIVFYGAGELEEERKVRMELQQQNRELAERLLNVKRRQDTGESE